MKRVLYYTGSLASGGAERQLIYTALAAEKNGYEVKIVIDNPTCHYTDMLKASNAEVICTYTTWHNPVKRCMELSRVIKTYRPAIVHSFQGAKNLWGMAIAKLNSVPLKIASIRSTNEKEFTGITFYKYWADKIICNSRMAMNIAQRGHGVPEAKLALVYNAIDLRRFAAAKPISDLRSRLGLPDNTMLGVLVASFSKSKNHLGLVRGLRILQEEGFLGNIHFLFVGNPADKELFEIVMNEVKNAGLSQKISFLGIREDVPEILKACDFMMLPSFYEGFPNVVLEAMTAGVFVIATPTGGTPELVEDEVNGLLANGCTPEDLANSLRSYLKMENSQIEAIRLGGADYATRFDKDQAFEKIFALYEGSF